MLSNPIQIGDAWFYSWGGYTHDYLDGIFNYNASGMSTHGGTTNDYRFATLNGVQLALPTSGTSSDYGDLNYDSLGTDLAGIWEHNRSITEAGGATSVGGTFWSATKSTGGFINVHDIVNVDYSIVNADPLMPEYLVSGYVKYYEDTEIMSVMLQVL